MNSGPLLSRLFIDYLIETRGEDLPEEVRRDGALPVEKAWSLIAPHVSHLEPLAQVLIRHEKTGHPVSNESIDSEHPRWPNTRPDLVSAINGQLAIDDGPLTKFLLRTVSAGVFWTIESWLDRSEEKIGDAQLTAEVRDAFGYECIAKSNPETARWMERCLDAYQAAWIQAGSDFLNPAITSRTTAFRIVRNKAGGNSPKRPTKYVIVRTRSACPRLFTFACWWAHRQDGSPNVIVIAEREDGNVLLSSGMSFRGFEGRISGLAVDEGDAKQAFVPKESQPDIGALVALVKKAVEDSERPLPKAVPPTAEVGRNTAVSPSSRPVSAPENRPTTSTEKSMRPARRNGGLTHNPFAALAGMKLAK